ncbi:MAG: histidine kinase dimerization/phosphoacceptor domain -containing protein [Spirochaetales bacterium]
MPSADNARFRDLDFVPLGLAVIDKSFRVLFWNSCMAEWTGVPRAMAEGGQLDRLAPEWATPQYRERVREVFLGGPPVVFSPLLHPEIIPVRPGESPVYNVKVTALPEEDGWLGLLSVEDITVLSQRIVKLRELQKRSELLMREIHHRVKNNLNMVSSLITLQSDISPDETVRTLEDLQSRIIAISQVHDVLYRTDDLSLGKAADYLGPLAQLINQNLSAGHHDLVLDLDDTVMFDIETTIQLGLIQAELMTNALKYGFRNPVAGQLTVSLRRLPTGETEYGLSQTGDTLPKDFDPQQSTGLGMQLILTFAAQLGCDFQWKRGDPTTFTLRFRR